MKSDGENSELKIDDTKLLETRAMTNYNQKSLVVVEKVNRNQMCKKKVNS